jgi:hypothetical protein
LERADASFPTVETKAAGVAEAKVEAKALWQATQCCLKARTRVTALLVMSHVLIAMIKRNAVVLSHCFQPWRLEYCV